MYTGIRELLVEAAVNDPVVQSLGLTAADIFRADLVYDKVDSEEFVVLRFQEPTDIRSGSTQVVPYDILGYSGGNDTDRMKKISAAVRSAHERAGYEQTESGHFTCAEFVSTGADQYDVGYKSTVLVTRMRYVGSGY
jgi:hypothetical protein